MKNILYAQSGGATAVINTSAAGVIETAKNYPKEIDRIYAGKNGIYGIIAEDLIDVTVESATTINKLRHTPGCIFGSCRYKLGDTKQDDGRYSRIVEVFRAHNIGYFIYNGGGDSQDTTNKIYTVAKKMGYPVACVGIPKTIDNDLPITDNSPGFGSVAKYVATSVLEVTYDISSMALTSTKIFILEVMGRHSGWIAASAGLAKTKTGHAPQIILFPEIPFDQEKFVQKVKSVVEQDGFCIIVVSEGIRDKDTNQFLTEAGHKDQFGHAQLGGVATVIANIITKKLGLKLHWAVADYLQRAARHIGSKTDVEQAYALGKAALEMALKQETGMLPIIKRISDTPYQWTIEKIELAAVANIEKLMPQDFIDKDGFGITAKCENYLKPLIHGEDYPPYVNGLPDYAQLTCEMVKKKLPYFKP